MAGIPANYDEQVYAALLGKVIGVQYGGPIEGWTAERIWQTYGQLTGYVRHYHYFRPDDDLSGPLVFIRALEDFTPTEDLAPQDIGNTWLNYLGDGHCTLWWGGYGVSTEHTAYLNLANGIPAPRSGSIEQNGPVVAEQIGGQIFIDTWGLVCPGDPEKAARYARKAASVSHDGNGVYGGMFVASIEAAAFGEKDVHELIGIGLSTIPADSLYAQVVRDVVGWSQTYADWRDCFARIKERYGYDRYGGGCHIIPNAAVVVMGLAYSQNDFSRALHVSNMAGWDTDCNVGNVGCIMGLVAGLEGIHGADTDWFSDVNDHVLASLILGSECILDIPTAALYVSNLGRAVNGIGDLQVYKGGAKYHFSFPGSTHCWEYERQPGTAAIRDMSNTVYSARREAAWADGILPERSAQGELREQEEEQLLAALQEGDIRKGKVISLHDFGALVDLGGAHGLIHRSELSWRPVSHPGTVLQIGDEIQVYVLNVDHDRGRIGLSLKRLESDARSASAQRDRVDQLVEGTITQHTTSSSRALRVVMDRLLPDNQGVAYRKTFFTGEDIARSGYDIGTSPIIYPGQTLRASLYLSSGEDVTARLFVRDYYTKEMLCGEEASLSPGASTTLSFPISSHDPVLLDRMGVLFAAADGTNAGRPPSAVVYLDRVHWSGEPDYRIDLTRPDAMAGWGYLRGRWFSRAGALNGSHYGRDAEAYTGLLAWKDYRYEVRLRPHCGTRHRILFRVRGAQRSYALSLAPEGRVALEKNWQGYREVASAPFEWELGREYELAVQAIGNRIEGYVDGRHVLQWEDAETPWESGCVGLGLRNGRTMFIAASLRPTP